jgi:cell division control protein 6
MSDTISLFGNPKDILFLDGSILSPGYIPKRLIARDEQIKKVANLFAPVLSLNPPHNSIIYGKTGTGKTVVVKYVYSKLHEEIEKNKVKTNIKNILVNCQRFNTSVKAIISILNKIDLEYNVPAHGLSLNDYYAKLYNLLNKKNLSIIVILDEIDQLKDQDILYGLSRASENQDIDVGIFIGIIGITNDTNFAEILDPRIISSLRKFDIVFPPYDADQLSLILRDRAIAFKEGVLTNSVIPLCSAYSAQEHGDARKAINLLRLSGEIAQNERAKTITQEHVKIANDQQNIDCMVEVIKTLPTQSMIVLRSIFELSKEMKEKFNTGQVLSRYYILCEDNSCKKLSRTRISQLISELEMLGIINTRLKTTGGHGKTRLISLNIPKDKVETILYS